MAGPWPDLADVKVPRDVFEEEVRGDGVVVRGVPGLELDPGVEDGHEAASLAVEGVDEGSDGLFRVVDRVEGEVLPSNSFFFFFFFGKGEKRVRERNKKKK